MKANMKKPVCLSIQDENVATSNSELYREPSQRTTKRWRYSIGTQIQERQWRGTKCKQGYVTAQRAVQKLIILALSDNNDEETNSS